VVIVARKKKKSRNRQERVYWKDRLRDEAKIQAQWSTRARRLTASTARGIQQNIQMKYKALKWRTLLLPVGILLLLLLYAVISFLACYRKIIIARLLEESLPKPETIIKYFKTS